MSDTDKDSVASDKELKHIRRGHAAHVTALCNRASSEMSNRRSKRKLGHMLEQLEAAVKSLSIAHTRYVDSLESEHQSPEQEWFTNRFEAANEVIHQIAEYLTHTSVKSMSVISSVHSHISDHSVAMKGEQVKLKAIHAEENVKLVSQIAELQAQQKQQEARHLKEMADLENNMYQAMQKNIEPQARPPATPQNNETFVQQWLKESDLHHPNQPNPHTKPFCQKSVTQQPQRLEHGNTQTQSIDSWIDALIIGQETTLVPTDSRDSLAHTLVKLESERDLPKIGLPVFNGDALTWPRFIEQFFVQIHCRPGIADTRRMDLLQSHVDGEAKRLVQGLGYSGRNYAFALKELKSSFGHRIKVCRAVVNDVASGAQIPSRDPTALRRFYVAIRDCIATLQQMNYLSDLNSSDIVLKVSKRLPSDKVSRWNEFVRNIATTRDPNLIDLQNWLRDRVEADFNPYAIPATSESSQQKANKYSKNYKQNSGFQEKRVVRKQSAKLLTINDNEDTAPKQTLSKVPCAMCGEAHYLYRCPLFANKTVAERKNIIVEHNLCFNCLKPSHRASKCFSTVTCQEKDCGKKHHTLLHDLTSEPVEVLNRKMQSYKTKVYLQIVPVHAYGPNGRIIKTYALLDSGSDVTLIHKNMAKDLGLSGERRKLRVKTYNGVSTENSLKVSLDIESASDLDSQRIHVNKAWAVDTDAFYCLPQQINHEWKHLKDLKLPEIDSCQVNMLIGVDVPEAHLQVDMIQGLENQPIAVKTLLGWTLMGITDGDGELHHETQARINFTIARDQHLNNQLEDFWKTESFGVSHTKIKPYSVEDEKAQQILETTTQLVEGHYQIDMLWRDETTLPSNLKIAEKRFKLLIKRIVRDPDFGVCYSKTLNDYVLKGHAEMLHMDEIESSSSRAWYLPHHGVTNPNKPGKVRVVFDAAASHLGTSLNDKLMTGPDLVNNLFGILQRFRLYKVAIAADIEAMYHQVRVPKKDSDSLRFLWKSDPKKPGPPDVYWMKVHVFGAVDSSSFANYAVKRTAKDNIDRFEQSVIDTALNNFYVDDLLKSVETEAAAKHLVHDLTNLMKLGGFHLHKWISNSKCVLNSVAESERAVSSKYLDLDEIPTMRALGLEWNIVTDSFVFDPKIHNVAKTKRGVVSTVSSIFDPCGYLAPYTIRAKCLIQDLWKLSLDWDDNLPPEFLSKWNDWLDELQDLCAFNLCRHHKGFSSQSSVNELHVFADASEKSFGACAYLHYSSDSDQDNATCSFLAAKTRVAPIKPSLTIPRLELQGDVLAVRLWLSLKDELAIPIKRVVFWTDSNTVLQYLNNCTRRFKPFVANRIAEILDTTQPQQWHHVPSEMNPADHCTRGLRARQHTVTHPWLQGPTFLWPKPPNSNSVDALNDDPEIRKSLIINTRNVSDDTTLVRKHLSEPQIVTLLNPADYSSWQRLCRTSAWVLRAARNFLSKLKRLDLKPRIEESLTVSECEEALLMWVQEAQRSAFHNEISCIESQERIPSKSPLLPLSPFYDGRHLRVGGRLRKANIPSEAKHQLLLPDHHAVTQLLMDDMHKRNAHSGPEHIISTARQRFWPIHA